MLPSGIAASLEAHARSRTHGGTLLLRGSGGGESTTDPGRQARGPLAQRVLRLLGIGATGQAYQSWAIGSMQAAFGASPAATGSTMAWLAARSLPTPNGRFRATMGPSWRVDDVVAPGPASTPGPKPSPDVVAERLRPRGR